MRLNVNPRLIGRAELEEALGGPVFIIAHQREIKLVVASNIIAAIEQVNASRGPLLYVWAERLGILLRKYEWEPAQTGKWVLAK